ncbi:Cyclin-L2 [Nowakowskiella sp. JEL0078]|nr:Cyclin-L2 [Nowakowskiella sp. JEL0078]
MNILAKLGFNVHVQLPYGFLINYLKAFELDGDKRVVQKAWNYLNDGLRTNIYVCYQPTTIACAAIFLTTRQLEIKLPDKELWCGVFDADYSEILEISYKMMTLYDRGIKINLPLTKEELQKLIEPSKASRKHK